MVTISGTVDNLKLMLTYLAPREIVMTSLISFLGCFFLLCLSRIIFLFLSRRRFTF